MSPNDIPEVNDIISPTCLCWRGIWQTTCVATDVMFSRHYPKVESPERIAHGAHVLREKFWKPQHIRDKVHNMPVKPLFKYAERTALHEWWAVEKELSRGLPPLGSFYSDNPPEGVGDDWRQRLEWERQHDIRAMLDAVMAAGHLKDRDGKKRKIYELSRIERWTYLEIKERFGVTPSYITKIVTEIQIAINKLEQENQGLW